MLCVFTLLKVSESIVPSTPAIFSISEILPYSVLTATAFIIVEYLYSIPLISPFEYSEEMTRD